MPVSSSLYLYTVQLSSYQNNGRIIFGTSWPGPVTKETEVKGGTSIFDDWWLRPKIAGDLDPKKLVILLFEAGVVMVIYLKKVWWFGDFGHKILVIWWFTVRILIVFQNGDKFRQSDGLPPNLRVYISKTMQKLVMVIEAKKADDLVIQGGVCSPRKKII